MADDFFLAFGREISGAEPVAGKPAEAAPVYETGGQWKIWLAVFVALILAMIFAF